MKNEEIFQAEFYLWWSLMICKKKMKTLKLMHNCSKVAKRLDKWCIECTALVQKRIKFTGFIPRYNDVVTTTESLICSCHNNKLSN